MYSTRLYGPDRKGHDLSENENIVSFGYRTYRLKAENLVVELRNGLGRLESERGGRLLHRTDHGGRTADEGLDILCGAGAPVL